MVVSLTSRLESKTGGEGWSDQYLEGVLVVVSDVELELDLALRLLVCLVVPEERARPPVPVPVQRRPAKGVVRLFSRY